MVGRLSDPPGGGITKGGFPYLRRRRLAARRIGWRLITHAAHRRFSAKSSSIKPIRIVMIPGPGMPGTDMLRPSATSAVPKRFFRKTAVHRTSG
jgi:hypothetical protein